MFANEHMQSDQHHAEQVWWCLMQIFGGAVLALVSPEEVGPFSRRVAEEYQQETRYQPHIFAVQIADGAEVLER